MCSFLSSTGLVDNCLVCFGVVVCDVCDGMWCVGMMVADGGVFFRGIVAGAHFFLSFAEELVGWTNVLGDMFFFVDKRRSCWLLALRP